ncbi:c-type cytochrome [Azohydromonas sediminis]|uniref:c-type cytochrome n=1 Tax=Azohydromonas sediminis TaxID=2259674 RepID=UPI000E654E65|nr:cytochrome C [Azohydromonas sediminis]
MNTRRDRWGTWRALGAAVVVACTATAAHADAQLAADKGCYNCHGTPPKKNAPTFAQLAADYAKYRGDDGAVRQLADKLRSGSIFGHIDAHERLSATDAERLVRWIVDGAPPS